MTDITADDKAETAAAMNVLYHYCPTESFSQIVESRALCLSSLSLSNDTLEGKIVAKAIDSLARRDRLDRATCERLQSEIKIFDQITEGLGFCLSEDGDVLSQWRGYADDASGVAIGFSGDYLRWLAQQSLTSGRGWGFGLRQVKYDPSEHQAEVEPIYLEANKLIGQGAYRVGGMRGLLETRTEEEIELEKANLRRLRDNLSMVLMSLFPKLYLLKSPAFLEEKEWRLLSYRFFIESEPPVSYRAAGNRLVAYRRCELAELERQPISDVVLGPKHLTPVHMIKALLKQEGFGDVPVRTSAASYR
jgi:hypothetical protein